MQKSFVGRHIIAVSLIGAGLFATNIPKYMGKIKLVLTPSVSSKDIQTVKTSFKDQQMQIIKFEHNICELLDPCNKATQTNDVQLIETTCLRAKREVAHVAIPQTLPIKVIKNLSLYQQSLLNTTQMTVDRWKSTETKKSGDAFFTFLKHWEIDTCSYESIPQQVYRLYQLDKITNQNIVECKDFKALYESLRLPATQNN